MENLPHDHWLKTFQFTRQNRVEVYPTVDPTSPSNSVAGKVVIITGASRGLGGEGLAPIFAKAGAKGLVLVATNVEKLQQVEKSINENYPEVKTLTVGTDVSDQAAVDALFEKVRASFGHADILVNNAAYNSTGGAIHEEPPQEWWRNFEVNTLGAFQLYQGFIKLLPDPNSTPAAIVNITTGASWAVIPPMSGYSISKLAPLQLTTHVGAAYPNITAVSLHPGLMETDGITDDFLHFHHDPIDYVASVALWAASEQAKFMSGRIMTVNFDVDELIQRKNEIVEKDLLKLKIGATFGPEQFQ